MPQRDGPFLLGPLPSGSLGRPKKLIALEAPLVWVGANSITQAIPNNIPIMTTIHSAYFDSQPFFVLDDAAYERTLAKLRRGEAAPSFLHRCPHEGPNRTSACICPRFENRLEEDNRIVRVWENKTKPVISITTLAALTAIMRSRRAADL